MANKEVLSDILALSSGTLATLTGEKRLDRLNAIQNEFFIYVKNSKKRYKTWIEAWDDFEDEVLPILKRVFKARPKANPG